MPSIRSPRWAVLGLATALCAAASGQALAQAASAVSDGVRRIEAVRDAAVKVGPAFPRAERITCDTTAGGIAIQPTGGFNLISYECTAKGAVTVGSKTGAHTIFAGPTESGCVPNASTSVRSGRVPSHFTV